MRALAIPPVWPKCTSMNLPKRLELLLRSVFALPNASSSGFAWSTFASTFCSEPATSARYERQCFVASVLPAPLSPEIRIAWSALSSAIALCAAAATWKTCGAMRLLPGRWYSFIVAGV